MMLGTYCIVTSYLSSNPNPFTNPNLIIRDVRPYVTSYTWSLEKIFCRPKNSRYIIWYRTAS